MDNINGATRSRSLNVENVCSYAYVAFEDEESIPRFGRESREGCYGYCCNCPVPR